MPDHNPRTKASRPPAHKCVQQQHPVQLSETRGGGGSGSSRDYAAAADPAAAAATPPASPDEITTSLDTQTWGEMAVS